MEESYLHLHPLHITLFVSIYWGVLFALAEHADNVLEGAILYEAVNDQQ